MSTAKKTEATIVPTVGMVLMPRSVRSHHTPFRVASVGSDGVKAQRARSTCLVAFSTMNDKYRVASPEEAAAFDASVAVRAVEHVAPALSTEPATPRAMNDTPPSEPPPAPPANDAPAMPGLAKVDAALFIESQRRADERVAKLENSVANLVGMVTALLQHQVAPAAAALPAVAPTAEPKRDDLERARIVKAERPWADPLVQDFIAAEMERVTFATAGEIERAMFPGEFHEALRVWCDMNGKATPDPRTTYAVLQDIAPNRHLVKGRGKDERHKVGLARRRQMALDLDGGGDFGEAMARARGVWPLLKDDATAANGIRLLLSDKRTSKAEVLDAIAGAALEQRRKGIFVDPGKVFASLSSARVFARIARDLGGAK